MIVWMRRLWRWLRWVLLVAGLSVGGWLGWTASLRSEFEREVQALRKAGEPVKLSELLEGPGPEGSNAAPLIKQAYGLMGDDPELDMLRNPEWYKQRQLVAAQKWLEGQSETIELLHRASVRPRCSFGTDWTEALRIPVWEFEWTGACASLLEAWAKKRARDGDAAEALRALETLLRLGRHGPRGTVLCYAFRVSIQASAMTTLRDVAHGKAFDPEAARARFEPLMEESLRLDPALYTLSSERARGISLVRQWVAGDSPWQIVDPDAGEGTSLKDWIWSSWIMRPFAYKDGLAALRFLGTGIERLKDGNLEAMESMAPIEVRAPDFISGLLSDRPYHTARKTRILRARVAVTRAGLDALVLRKKNGRFPATMRLPIDPFGGKPLRYTVRVDGTARIESARPIRDEFFRKEEEIAWELK